MFNPQSYAVQIEKIGHFSMHSADEIRRDPIGYLDTHCLDALEHTSDEKSEAVCAFWDKYTEFKGKSIDELGEDIAEEFVKDFRELCHK